MVVCIGDSITEGLVGYSYVSYIPAEYKAVNKGVNGDTCWGVYQRLCHMKESSLYEEAETFVVEVGTNDILQPYLSRLSPLWKVQVGVRNLWKKFCAEEQAFAETYEKILALLAQGGKRMILIALPYMQLENYPLEKVCRFNKVIQNFAEEYQAQYVDIFHLQKQVLEQDVRMNWGWIGLARVSDVVQMLLFPQKKDKFSVKRNLDLTVDGCHFNSRSAKILGEAVLECLAADKAKNKREEISQ